MVECEFWTVFIATQKMNGFNRYMVECEYKLGAGVEEVTLVLIDTWWNVNIYNYDSNIRRTNVLIDTWWNVNKLFSSFLYIFNSGFNRYMVECEFKTGLDTVANSIVLIDTWWNVNKCYSFFTSVSYRF